VGRSETQSPEAFDLVNGFEQLHKWRFIVDLRKFVATVEINDLSEKRDFFDAARNEIAHFAYNFVDRTAAFRAARLRNDAKSAVHVASLHDRDKRRGLPRRKLLVADRRLRPCLLRDIDNRKP
jgi:hypothetical protein